MVFFFLGGLDDSEEISDNPIVYKREIRRKGIAYVAVDQPIDISTPEGVLMEGMLESIAEYYSLNLATETMKGMKVRARQAKFNGGRPPFGFRIEEDKYLLDEPKASIMREIFEMVATGAQYPECLAKLANYRTTGGRPISRSGLYEMLRNPRYAGIYVYNRAPKRVDGHRNWHNSKSEEEIISVDGVIPPIVTKEVFDQVQRRLDARKHRYAHPRENRADYALTGKALCGCCGAPMTGYSKRGYKGKLYRYYYCNAGRRTGSNCDNAHWPKDETEQRVSQAIKEELESYAANKEMVDDLYAQYIETDTQKKELIEPLQKEIRSYEEKITRLLDMAEQGAGNVQALSQRITENEAAKCLLEQELSQVSITATVSKDDIRSYFLNIANEAADLENSNGLKRAIELYVEKITLHPGSKIEIGYLFQPTSACVYPGAGSAVLRSTHVYR
jgi:site-specific DNA recombinase